MLTESLFPVSADDVAMTTDEWYTPRWLFGAAGLTFDMDVCAPVAPELRTCPARRYLTVVEDGLTHPWEGLVWCNPPYSQPEPWIDRLIAHGAGLVLVQMMKRARWRGRLMRACSALTVIDVQFGRPDGTTLDIPWPIILAGLGSMAAGAVGRVAAADRYAEGSVLQPV